MSVRVAIFDDNALFLDSMSLLIEDAPGFFLCGAYTDCENLEDKINTSEPDVVMMDIEMPKVNGIEAVKMIKKSFPKLNVLMQTSFEDDDKVFNAICAGASGYILKNTLPARILESIIEVYQGGSPMSPSVARKVLGFLQAPPVISKVIPDYNLSNREKEVLSCLVKGMSYKMIADTCHISNETVRSHMKNIYEKLHVASMTEAVAKAINQGLV
ncbi:MAG: response regulator transcription factor [Bacteroidetes bacterium]|nr:response regulator transcription factor [Bacteroidota bacterium]